MCHLARGILAVALTVATATLSGCYAPDPGFMTATGHPALTMRTGFREDLLRALSRYETWGASEARGPHVRWRHNHGGSDR